MAHNLRKRKEDSDELRKAESGRKDDGEGKHLKLVLSDDECVADRDIASCMNTFDKEKEALNLGGALELEGNTFSQIFSPSSVSLYFKSISKYSLLNEDEEKKIACMIKDYENECTGLVTEWVTLVHRKYMALFTLKQAKDILDQLEKDHSFVALLDEISRLLKERKKIEHLLKQAKSQSAVYHEMYEAMNRVDAELSKSIAKIKLDEATMNEFMLDIEQIPYSRKVFKIRKGIELEMKKILRAICGTTLEIKNLKNQLVKANLRLVISIAKKYLNQGVALADLIQEGNLGLMRAIDTYDHVRGHRLVTYATWWIKQAMIRAIDCQSKTVRTPVYVNEKLNQIMKASNRLLQEWKREPTLSEIAAETNTTPESVEKVLKSSKDYIPLEYLVEDKSETVVDAAQDFSSGSIPAQVASEQLAHIVNTMVLSDLTDRERDIIKLRFGIGNEHDHTLEEIGKTFRLSRERIRQILETALRKMRTPAQLMLLREFANPN